MRIDGAANVRFCLLRKETGWGRPPWLKTMPSSEFSDGYRFMIRFYAVAFSVLTKRGDGIAPDLRVRSCHVQEHVDGPFRPTYYVAPPHDATQAHRQRPPNFIAPFCGPGRRTALE
jgi:hypothetical protein